MRPHVRSLRVAHEALQAAARGTLRLCRLSKPAQAGLEPQAPAPQGLIFLGATRRKIAHIHPETKAGHVASL